MSTLEQLQRTFRLADAADILLVSLFLYTFFMWFKATASVLFTPTFWTFVREISPIELRAGYDEVVLTSIDTRTAVGAIWSRSALVFLLGDIARRPGTPWHLLAPLTGRHVRPPLQG